ncbi:MAG: DUF5680 domain-containing protein [Candidatus Babeliales bacterium]|jgi:hypothetical protein
MTQHSDSEQIAISASEFLSFLKKAKQQTYANEANDPPRVNGCKEYIYQDGQWHYRDYYGGVLAYGGMELVRFNDQPVWMMGYYGGIVEPIRANLQKCDATGQEVFAFLKKALLLCPSEMPLRGPDEVRIGRFSYKNNVQGSLVKFCGEEVITCDSTIIYEQKYIGGVLQGKHYHVSIA